MIVAFENLVPNGVIGAEYVETDQASEVLSQVGVSMPPNVDDDVTDGFSMNLSKEIMRRL